MRVGVRLRVRQIHNAVPRTRSAQEQQGSHKLRQRSEGSMVLCSARSGETMCTCHEHPCVCMRIPEKAKRAQKRPCVREVTGEMAKESA